MSRRMKGVIIGLVTDLDDPEGLGRIRLEYPTLSNSTQSTWARVAAPLAGPELGFWFQPEVGDEALVAFEQDDFRRPYVLGYLWNGEHTPPQAEPSQRLIHSVSGHRIVLDDTSGEENITIEDASGSNTIVLNKDGITIETTGDFKLKATNVEIEASAQLTAKGNPIHLNP